MKLMKIIALSIALLSLTQIALAATGDGHYTLRVGNEYSIPPGQELPIYFDVLDPDNGSVFYDVHCEISANSRIHLSAYMNTLNHASVVLNGHPIYMDGDTLVPGNNTLDIFNVNALNGSFTLRNEELRGSNSYFDLYAGCVSSFHH